LLSSVSFFFFSSIDGPFLSFVESGNFINSSNS
jgi:hypothetical protein